MINKNIEINHKISIPYLQRKHKLSYKKAKLMYEKSYVDDKNEQVCTTRIFSAYERAGIAV